MQVDSLKHHENRYLLQLLDLWDAFVKAELQQLLAATIHRHVKQQLQ
jgi:hypothetical protein